MTMKTWRNREELLCQVTTLARSRMSRRAIARALGVSRNTVRKLLEQHERAREAEPPSALPPPRAPRRTKLDAYRERVTDLLQRYPDITARRIFEELRADGYEGGHTAVKDHVRRLRPKSRPEPSRPTTVHGPAEMAENDWSPHTIKFTHAPAAVVQVFAYVLIYSTRKHFALYERSDLHALMEGHVETFEHFGGAAHKCKYDSQKAVVLGWEGNQPIYNPRFLSFSVHYDMRPVACRRFKPNDKPRVERAFWEFERSFLNGRSFRDLEDMRAQLRWWQDNVAIRGLGDGARNGRGWSSSPRSSPCCGRCRGTAMTPRGSSIDCAASMATCRGTATVTRCPTSTTPTSCRCGSRHGSCSCTPPICAAWPATSSRRAAPVRTWGASDTTHGGRESEAPTSTSCG